MGLLWRWYEPSSFPYLLPLLSHCGEPGSQLKDSAPCLCISPTPPAFPGICCCWACSLGSSRAETHHPAATEIWKTAMAVQRSAGRCGSGGSPAFCLPVPPQHATADALRPAPAPADAEGEDALSACFHCLLFFQASWRLSRPEAAFQLHKPLALFGVMILLFNRLCFSLGRLIPQCD